MKTPIRHALALALIASLSAATSTRGIPFASGIKNESGTISFVLNEDADNVKVIFDGGGVGNTNDLGSLSVGTHQFSLGSHTSYEIHVSKATAVGWTKISTNGNPKYNVYWSPGGIAINNNSADLERFGRIYVLENQGGDPAGGGNVRGFIDQGIYILNADFSDALGRDDTASTGGIEFETGGANDGVRSPNKIEIGEDGYIYVADWSVTRGTVYRFDPEITTGEVVLGEPGQATPSVHTTINGSAIVKGSLAGGDLTVWAVDGLGIGGSAPYNQLRRWDINAGPLPFNGTPTGLATNGVADVADIQSDLDIAPDGKIFLTQNRAVTAGGYTNRASVNLRVFDTDGVTELWNSHQESTNALGNATAGDIFALARAVKVSPDNKKVALIVNSTHVWIMDLTNGIPDISTRVDLNAFALTSTSTAHRREVAWDAAGNLYAGNNSSELIVVWSPGGSHTAITSSGGAFQLVQPETVVTVTNLVTSITEGSTEVAFRIERSGDIGQSLLVTYTMGGSASSGTDYMALPGSLLFAPGQTVTNISLSVLADAETEATETITLVLAGAGAYSIGTPANATVSVLDANTPEISISGTSDGTKTNLLEAFADARAIFSITRIGSLAAATTVNLTYGGSAVHGVDFNGPASITLLPGATSTNLILTPINDSLVEAPETFTVTIAAGSYQIGATNSASGVIYSEDVTPGTVLFADAFDSDTSANWIVHHTADEDSEAVFGYDYSQMGIPEAPNSSGSSAAQKGLRLRAHLTTDATVTPGISVSPLNGDFGEDYRLRFDMWMNHNGPLAAGGAGSTQNSSYGVGTTAQSVTSATSTAEGIWFTATGDGGVADTSVSQADFGIMVANSLIPVALGYYAAGTDSNARGNGHPYYTVFGGSAAPVAQLNNFPSQTGAVNTGGLGMAWHAVTLTKSGDIVTWEVDGYLLATVPISETYGQLPGNNIFLGFFDWFASANGAPDLQFVIYDNVRIESFATPLQITAIELIDGGTQVRIAFSASNTATPEQFQLHTAAEADGSYQNDPAAIISGAGGVFEAITPVSGERRFYRIYQP